MPDTADRDEQITTDDFLKAREVIRRARADERHAATHGDSPDACLEFAIASALREARREAEDAAEERVADAYQLFGAIAIHAGLFDHPDVIRALDYLSGREIEGDILPWPRSPLPRIRALEEK